MLITGANGVIGSDLVKFFSKKNKVFALYRTPNKITKTLKNKNIIWIKHDLSNKIKKNINPKIIIHCAVTHAHSKKNKYSDYLNSNIIGLKNVLDFSKRKKVKKIFHLSTINVYGLINSKILNETNPFIKPNLLGATKILMEEMISTQSMNYLNIRLPGVVGYQINDTRRPWFCKIANKLKNNEDVEIFNDEKKFNNLLDSYEVFKFINFMINKKKFLNGEVNFAASKPKKLRSIINQSKKILNSESKINYNKKKNIHFIISTNKLSKLYNYKISRIDQIVSRYLNHFKKNF